MKNDVENINQAALEELCKNETYHAQTLFRQNAKNNPSFKSFNNLGVFYAFEGLFKPDYSRRNATKLGIKYLKKAETLQKSYFTLFALGYIYFGFDEYKEAGTYFKQAFELKHSYASAYNLGLSFYRQFMYEYALNWFEKALNLCDDSNHIETYSAYLFVLLQIDKKKCREALNHLLADNVTPLIEYNKFILSYLCGDMVTAESLIRPMMGKFSLNLKEIAMVFDCLFKFNKRGEAEEYLKNKVEVLKEHDYRSRYDIKQFEKAFSQQEYRKNLISYFRYDMSIVKECCYYGCKQHNPI